MRTLCFIILLFIFTSPGSSADETAFPTFKNIANLLINREQIIHTAVLEYESATNLHDEKQQQFEKGIEKYKLNRSYTHTSMSSEERSEKPMWTTAAYWNGTSSYKWDLGDNTALVDNSKAEGIIPLLPAFYKISFIQPNRCFKMETYDPVLSSVPNDIWMLRKDEKPFSIGGKIFNETSFISGACVLANAQDNLLRFTLLNPTTKKPYQIIEFGTKWNCFPVRVVSYRHTNDNVKEGATPYTEIIANDIREVAGGIFLAFHVKRTTYRVEGNRHVISSEDNITVKNAEINGKIDDAEFTPKFPKGTQVIDKQKGIMYTVK